MNADDAKRLHLPALIEAAGGKRDEQRSKGGDEWFFSPFRPDERTASLKATRGRNGNWMFTDYGSGKGGNVIAFANMVLGREPDDRGIRDALQWLRSRPAYETAQLPPRASQRPAQGQGEAKRPAYRITARKELHRRNVLRYIEGRGVNKAFALKYLDEVTFQDDERQRVFYGLGMNNEAGGVEITTATEKPFKTCIGAKAFTKIEGDSSPTRHVFEGMFDFLTYLTLHGREAPTGTAYILHSVAMIDRVRDALTADEGAGLAILWLDNDQAGQDAQQRLIEGLGAWAGDVATMNHLYADFKDLNHWYATTRPPQITEAAPKFMNDTAWNQLNVTRRTPTPQG